MPSKSLPLLFYWISFLNDTKKNTLNENTLSNKNDEIKDKQKRIWKCIHLQYTIIQEKNKISSSDNSLCLSSLVQYGYKDIIEKNSTVVSKEQGTKSSSTSFLSWSWTRTQQPTQGSLDIVSFSMDVFLSLWYQQKIGYQELQDPTCDVLQMMTSLTRYTRYI